MYRLRDGQLQVLLAHPGGPFFKNKDDGEPPTEGWLCPAMFLYFNEAPAELYVKVEEIK